MPSNNPFGYAFAPTQENASMGRPREGTAVQGPLQVLSYRLKPSPAIAGGFSPLAGDQPTGVSNNALIQSILHTVLGPEAAREFLAHVDQGSQMRGGAMGGPSQSFRPQGREARNPFQAETPAPVIGIGQGGQRSRSGLDTPVQPATIDHAPSDVPSYEDWYEQNKHRLNTIPAAPSFDEYQPPLI